MVKGKGQRKSYSRAFGDFQNWKGLSKMTISPLFVQFYWCNNLFDSHYPFIMFLVVNSRSIILQSKSGSFFQCACFLTNFTLLSFTGCAWILQKTVLICGVSSHHLKLPKWRVKICLLSSITRQQNQAMDWSQNYFQNLVRDLIIKMNILYRRKPWKVKI